MAATVGWLVVLVPDPADVKALTALLAIGQMLGHLVLGTGGHVHGTTAVPSALMLAAHVAAVLLGTALIAVGGHLAATVSRVLRTAIRRLHPPVVPVAPVVVASADQPLRSALQLAASMSHRGPPVSFAR